MKNIERRKFLGSALGFIGLTNLRSAGFEYSFKNAIKSDESDRTVRLKGKEDSKVKHWDIITIGNLSRNRYWGESDERPLHSAI